MKKNVKLVILSLFSFSLFFIWWIIYLPKSLSSVPERLFLIEKGENLFQISENLQKQDLVKNKFFFTSYIFLKGKSKTLQAGEYSLSPSMTVPEIAGKIISGEIAKIEVTIPEGFTMNQIVQELNSNLLDRAERETPRRVATQISKLQLKTQIFKNEYAFLEDIPDEMSLEGFLFPDTYYFFYQTKPDEIIKKILDNFDKKLNEDLRKDIAFQNKSIFGIVTMASLLEKEVKTLEDKKLASGILWKRLKSGIPLQVDATIIYITGKKTTKVSKEETQIASPYNTYKYKGLPVGPICNPGFESIEAAVYPEDSEYWYYLSTPAGKTIFSKTLEEHNIAKAKYLK